MARPTKLTPERAKSIIDMVRNGAFYVTAARANRIHENTINLWIRRGEAEGTGKYYKFMCALEEAEALAELDAMTEWKVARKATPSEIREYLRRHFAHWNVADKAEIKQEIKEDTDVIDARVNEYFEERKRRGVILRDDTEESIHTDNTDTETGSTPKE